MLQRLAKPWFLYRPDRLLRRVAAALAPPKAGYAELRTSWGVPVIADPARTIGRSILTTGIYDLAVSEALVRLISPGDTVVDAGANIGYMTILASVAAAPAGKVISFEPHPGLFEIARRNVATAREHLLVAEVDLRETALAARTGPARLELPVGFESNDGTARLHHPSSPDGGGIPVELETFDGVLAYHDIAVLKLDVEGSEAQVLQGARRALAKQRIRHVLFEDHDIARSEVAGALRAFGYRLFSLGWSVRGLRVQPVELGSLARSYEAPSFIATVDPQQVSVRCSPDGWRVLGRHLTDHCRRSAGPSASRPPRFAGSS